MKKLIGTLIKGAAILMALYFAVTLGVAILYGFWKGILLALVLFGIWKIIGYCRLHDKSIKIPLAAAAASVLIFGVSVAVDGFFPTSDDGDTPVQSEKETTSNRTPSNRTETKKEDKTSTKSDSTSSNKTDSSKDDSNETDQKSEDSSTQKDDLSQSDTDSTKTDSSGAATPPSEDDSGKDDATPPSSEGDSNKDDTTPSSGDENTPDPEPNAEKTYLYVGSSESTKYHRPTCSAVKTIKDENLIRFTDKEDAAGKGYEPCGRCKP